MNGIESVKRNSTTAERFVTKTSSNGKFYFYLKAQNGEIIGSSEMYNSMEKLIKGIESVKNNAPKAITNKK